MSHRDDIQGLRAVAVLLVVLAHAGVPYLQGGFIGVDVFYVLSGFLITGLIARELERTGTVSLIAFYARRARRLLPAAALVLIVTLVLSAALLPPLQVPDVAADGLAAGLYASNIRFALQSTDYLAADLAPSPLLHYWSLGVEEQFYLFWPALLLLVAKRGRSLVRDLTLTCAIVFSASFGLSVVLTEVAGSWAFFSLPTRAWELALGALIALGAARLARLPAAAGAGLMVVGVAMIVAAGLILDNTVAFPGTAAALPVFGTGLVIAGGAGRSAILPARLLALPPARFVGRISYSLYLWHWPLLVIPVAALETPLSWPVRLVLVGVAVIAAAATHRWVEEPLRHGRFIGVRPIPNLAAAGVAMVVIAVASLSVSSRALGSLPPVTATTGSLAFDPKLEDELEDELEDVLGPVEASEPPTPTATPATIPVPANLVPPLAVAREDRARVYADNCFIGFAERSSPSSCVYGDAGSDTVVVLWGDSHAAQWFPALERLATANHWRLLPLVKANCPPVDIPARPPKLGRSYPECTDWRAWALDVIRAERTDLVVISYSNTATIEADGRVVPSIEAPGVWNAALERTLGGLTEAARHVALISDSPHPKQSIPSCVSRHLDNVLECAASRSDAIASARIEAERRITSRLGVAFVDPTPWLCPSDPCPVVIGRLLVYSDSSHITATVAAALARRVGAELPLRQVASSG